MQKWQLPGAEARKQRKDFRENGIAAEINFSGRSWAVHRQGKAS